MSVEQVEGGLAGKVAIVTGAAAGIGAEVARQLAAAGARVAVFDVDRAGGERTAAAIGGTFVHCNVAEPDSWAEALGSCVAALGVPDFVHLNAGVMSVGASEPFLPIEQLPLARYRRIVGVNLDGVVFGLQALLPHMRERGGAITVTASIAGLIALPIDPMYSATKHALIGLVRSVAAGMPQAAVRLNAICPGGVDTAIVPDALRAGDMQMMRTADLAAEVVDLLQRGAHGEIRVKLAASAPAYAVQQPAL
jgi:NAD(P)-dependent dehydrogenase (short-subunit alcohol dehydrogenase family)